MARVLEGDRVAGVERRRRRAHPIGGGGAREGPVELADGLDEPREVIRAPADGRGQLGEDPRGLVLFLADGLDEIVVRLHDLGGLDEERLAAL